MTTPDPVAAAFAELARRERNLASFRQLRAALHVPTRPTDSGLVRSYNRRFPTHPMIALGDGLFCYANSDGRPGYGTADRGETFTYDEVMEMFCS